METNKIWNESNEVTLKEHIDDKSVDVILTSPFYNTNTKAGKTRTLDNTQVKEGQYAYVRYDVFVDTMSNEEYIDYTLRLFEGFDRVLKDKGVVLYNISYGGENPYVMFDTVNEICKKSNFMFGDIIVWKKKSALPNTVSPNKLTRIWEFVFVFCKKGHYNDYHMNKEVLSERPNGQKQYTVYYNWIEADNNDEPCPYNKATFSTELCYKLLNMYAPKNAVVYDPFMGSGTTALACKNMGLSYIGSELSKNQVEWAENRLMTGKGHMNENCDRNALF